MLPWPCLGWWAIDTASTQAAHFAPADLNWCCGPRGIFAPSRLGQPNAALAALGDAVGMLWGCLGLASTFNPAVQPLPTYTRMRRARGGCAALWGCGFFAKSQHFPTPALAALPADFFENLTIC